MGNTIEDGAGKSGGMRQILESKNPWNQEIDALKKAIETGDLSDLSKVWKWSEDKITSNFTKESLEHQLRLLEQKRSSYITTSMGGY